MVWQHDYKLHCASLGVKGREDIKVRAQIARNSSIKIQSYLEQKVLSLQPSALI